MTDTLTTLYAFVKQTIGGNRNTWGGINNGNFDKVEAALAGVTSKVVTGGSYSLTDTERRNRVLSLSGVLSANQTIVVQNTAGLLVVINNTTGNFVTLMKTASGTAINIPQGTTRQIVCDGNDVLYRDDAERVGEVFHHAGSTVPPGALECTGATPLRADYPDLFAEIGTTWGAGNGSTTFGIPNETDTGRFRRSRTSTVTVGTYQANAFKTHTHTGSVTVSGSGTTATESATHTHTFSGTTSGQSADHTHGFVVPVYRSGGAFVLAGGSSVGFDTTAVTLGTSNDHTHTYSGTTSAPSATHTHTFSVTSTGSFTSDASGSTETRPESAVYIACIRY